MLKLCHTRLGISGEEVCVMLDDIIASIDDLHAPTEFECSFSHSLQNKITKENKGFCDQQSDPLYKYKHDLHTWLMLLHVFWIDGLLQQNHCSPAVQHALLCTHLSHCTSLFLMVLLEAKTILTLQVCGMYAIFMSIQQKHKATADSWLAHLSLA